MFHATKGKYKLTLVSSIIILSTATIASASADMSVSGASAAEMSFSGASAAEISSSGKETDHDKGNNANEIFISPFSSTGPIGLNINTEEPQFILSVANKLFTEVDLQEGGDAGYSTSALQQAVSGSAGIVIPAKIEGIVESFGLEANLTAIDGGSTTAVLTGAVITPLGLTVSASYTGSDNDDKIANPSGFSGMASVTVPLLPAMDLSVLASASDFDKKTGAVSDDKSYGVVIPLKSWIFAILHSETTSQLSETQAVESETNTLSAKYVFDHEMFKYGKLSVALAFTEYQEVTGAVSGIASQTTDHDDFSISFGLSF